MEEEYPDLHDRFYDSQQQEISNARIMEEYVFPPKEESKLKRFLRSRWVNLILFLVTIYTTMIVGAMAAGVDPFEKSSNLLKGIPFSFTLLLILGAHEFGHYFAKKKYKMKATLPYFIPAPPFFLFGTFGAVIRIKSPILNRKVLFDIGAAGPLAGFFFTLIAIFYGLHISEVREITYGGSLFFGSSILFDVATRLIIGSIPPGFDVYLSPIAYAGWIGMIVTAINLMPMGQLDGGHIIYAVFGERHHIIAKSTFIMLIFMSFIWTGWLLWALIGLFMKVRHPKTLSDYTPLDTRRKLLGYVCILIFFVSFIPVPIQIR